MAITKIYKDQLVKRTVSTGSGDSGDFEEREVMENVFTGWQSDVTGEFLEADQAQMMWLWGRPLGGTQNYMYTKEAELTGREAEFKAAKEIAEYKAAQEAERATWRAQEEANRVEFQRQTDEANRQMAEQQARFEADRAARQAAKDKAAADAKAKLDAETKISSQTLLDDMQRIGNHKDNDLVAAEDKKVLTAEDKNELFNGTGQDEEKKKKQSILDKMVGRAAS